MVTRVKVVKTTCRICRSECGVNAYVEDGKLLKVEGMRDHPKNKGRLCIKGAAAPELVYDPDRIKYPMKKEGAGWKRISWDEALDIISKSLKEIKEKYGPQALALYRGCEVDEPVQLYERFLNVYGTPNHATSWGLCYSSKYLSHLATYGGIPIPESEKANCIILWGINPRITYTYGHDSARRWGIDEILAAKELGAKLIAIDPRRSEVAKKADLWLPIRPGTDLALALAMINVIIKEGLYDSAFVGRWAVGFDRLVEHVLQYTPDWAEKVTWIRAGDIENIARIYASNRPSTIETFEGTDHKTNSFQTQRALDILRTITGNLDMSGGESLPTRGQGLADISLKERLPKGLKPVGADEHPLFFDTVGQAVVPAIVEAILTGKPHPIRAMIMCAGNALVMWPNTPTVREAFKKLDFLVVSDLYMNDTAQLADIVLPSVTYLEKDNLTLVSWDWGGECLVVRQKAIEPVGECWPDWKFFIELARRMGYGNDFPWKDGEEIIDAMLKPLGFTFKTLKENPIVYNTYPQRYKKYERDGFNTPSRKAEIYSQKLKEYGYDPLPGYKEPKESPVSRPDLYQKYPLILTSFRTEHMHSWTHNMPSVHKVDPENYVEINPKDAAQRGIRDGDRVIVESARGSIVIKVKVTEDIVPGVVAIAAGFGGTYGKVAMKTPGANVNLLTDGKARDLTSGIPAYREVLCSITKA